MPLPWAPALPLTTDRLVLRRHEADDVDDLLAFHSDPDVVRYIPWPVRTREQVETTLALKQTQHRVDREGDVLVLAIEFEGRVIGEVLLKHEDDAEAELGYAMDARYHGRGLASEAARAMLGLAFGEFGLGKVIAVLDERNAASAALLERLGMTLERSFPSQFKGESVTELQYAILR